VAPILSNASGTCRRELCSVIITSGEFIRHCSVCQWDPEEDLNNRGGVIGLVYNVNASRKSRLFQNKVKLDDDGICYRTAN